MNEENRIPKIIHYCWFGGSPLPELALECIDSWKKYCPDYEIKEWNENNFNVTICDYTREAYEYKKWAFVSDYARFWILYHYGGLYFDTDVELIAPIHDLVERGPYMGLEEELDFQKVKIQSKLTVAPRLGLSVNPGLGLSANSGLGLYKDILDCYEKEHFLDKFGWFNTTTVVKRVSNLLQRYPIDIFDEDALIVNGVYIYKKEYFCPLDYRMRIMNKTENTRSIHHYTASWYSEDEERNAKIFTDLKKKFGPIVGKALGYFCTIPIRTRIFGLKRAIFPK